MNVFEIFGTSRSWDVQQYLRFWDLYGGIGEGLNSVSAFLFMWLHIVITVLVLWNEFSPQLGDPAKIDLRSCHYVTCIK